jgi:hypothetical protein
MISDGKRMSRITRCVGETRNWVKLIHMLLDDWKRIKLGRGECFGAGNLNR